MLALGRPSSPPARDRRHVGLPRVSSPRGLLVVLVACLLSLACISTVASSFTPPASVKIAFITSLSADANGIQFGQPGYAAFMLAVKTINNASATWRAANDPSLPRPLLANTTIEMIASDTKNNPGIAVNAAFDAANAGVIAMVGEYTSGPSQQLAYVTARYKIPQISPASSVVEFTTNHATLYPYFMRLVPQVALQSQQMAHLFVNYFNWKKIGILFASDPLGTGGATALVQEAVKVGLNVLVQASFNLGDTDHTFQIGRIVDSEARIIVFWGLSSDLQRIFRSIHAGFAAGRNPNLLGDGYQWFICHGAVNVALFNDASGKLIPDLASSMPGLMGMNYYIDHTSAEWLDMAAKWAAEPASPLTISIDPKVPPWTSDSCSAYDAVFMIAKGLQFMYDAGVDPNLTENRPDLYNAIRNRTFIGASGPINLNAVGDRVAGYGMFNWQPDAQGFVNIGTVSATGAYTQFPSAKMVYMGNDPNVRPADSPARRLYQIPSQTRTALIASASVLLVLLVVVQLVILKYRDHVLIKASSPIFLGLFILGIQLLCASVIPRSQEGSNSTSASPCNADLYLANIGYVLLVGALLVKTYRLSAIFNAQQLKVKNNMSDSVLLGGLAVLLVCEFALLIGLQYGAPMEMRLTEYATNEDYYSCRAGDVGSTNKVDSVHLPATIVVRFTLLVATAIMAFRVREIPDVFNESRQLLVTVYNLLFISALLPAIDGAMGRGKEISLLAYSACVFFICIVSTAILMTPKFSSIYKKVAFSAQGENLKKKARTAGHHTGTRMSTGGGGGSGDSSNLKSAGGTGTGVTGSTAPGQGGTAAGTTPTIGTRTVPSPRAFPQTTRPSLVAPPNTRGSISGPSTPGGLQRPLSTDHIQLTAIAKSSPRGPSSPSAGGVAARLISNSAPGDPSSPRGGARPLNIHMSADTIQAFQDFLATRTTQSTSNTPPGPNHTGTNTPQS